MIHSGLSESYLLFPERAPEGHREYSREEHETERQVSQAFKRYCRPRPNPYEIPYYPFVHQNKWSRCRWPYQVSFNLGFNPFAV